MFLSSTYGLDYLPIVSYYILKSYNSHESIDLDNVILTYMPRNELTVICLPDIQIYIPNNSKNNLQFTIHLLIFGPSASSVLPIVTNAHPILTRAKISIVKPKAFTSSLPSPLVLSKLNSYKHVLKVPKWKLGIQKRD